MTTPAPTPVRASLRLALLPSPGIALGPIPGVDPPPPLTVTRYKHSRYFALYEGDTLLCVTVYKKGAEAIRQRMEIGPQ